MRRSRAKANYPHCSRGVKSHGLCIHAVDRTRLGLLFDSSLRLHVRCASAALALLPTITNEFGRLCSALFTCTRRDGACCRAWPAPSAPVSPVEEPKPAIRCSFHRPPSLLNSSHHPAVGSNYWGNQLCVALSVGVVIKRAVPSAVPPCKDIECP